jgi:hypothetical protein
MRQQATTKHSKKVVMNTNKIKQRGANEHQ